MKFDMDKDTVMPIGKSNLSFSSPVWALNLQSGMKAEHEDRCYCRQLNEVHSCNFKKGTELIASFKKQKQNS